MIRGPPRSTHCISSAASDVYKRQVSTQSTWGTNTKIAPLLFISLIENAFKHGISYSAPSFINIKLEEHENGNIECNIYNSYFPKNENDKSGSGIGLESLQKRLELLYPGPVSYTHLRAHETRHDLVCRLLLEKKKKNSFRQRSARLWHRSPHFHEHVSVQRDVQT
eukprot:TRINITY_DN23824_c0_g1_i1.p1 TRINITY_DN23824_c0_g1~~TRINITY_DN23824_c0_g1_i1.p1  ORF type:complete len:166 (-),score=23.09 TRINITY_DN23824_c0_g1_i1:3-500(-)